MTLLKSDGFFASGASTIAIENRAPQCVFPEHSHDFYEIVLVEHGSGVHIFNDSPYALCSGTVCFVRDSDYHQFENVDQLHLTNVLYRSPKSFRFLSDIEQFLPGHGQDEKQQSHWQINQTALKKAKSCITCLEEKAGSTELDDIATNEGVFLQLLMLLRQSCFETYKHDSREACVGSLLNWLRNNYSEEINWEELADRFSLALRTMHRQVKQYTGMTPQRYLNRLRLLEARHRLFQTDDSITDIAYDCGFSDSNNFSVQFRREFSLSPLQLRNSIR
ncbi:HTH-type transcriptional activator RhaS [Budvicia aquatica]|uniref:Arabinose operon regulatory protein n=1 Tax=Budvicia aquatica TaxID=82979 RepID=A0A2C6DH51_9GAMM|nr:HTH-type transcriptional activator RhaS [Budvicia aquatica]PHI28083.1 HTH-type transcriptional activator RhaS [Budvicia aquatica]VFS45860.1 L-rhamnose operon regulatory protein rhaS [Budvicia aquatica]